METVDGCTKYDTYPPPTLEHCIIDNVALEGLEGITLEALWIFVGKYLKLDLPLPKRVQDATWSILLEYSKHLLFYILPVAREPYKDYNRWKNLHPTFGIPIVSDICPYTRYKSVPIKEEGVRGSCEHYYKRKAVSLEKLKKLTVDDVLTKWDKKFVIVASQRLREYKLCPEVPHALDELTPQQYVMVEAIARSRFNGEACAGRWSLSHYCNEPTVIFYIKNKLEKAQILESYTFSEAVKDRIQLTSLLTLKRFVIHPESRETLIAHKLYQLCMKSPNSAISVNEASKALGLGKNIKAINKLSDLESFKQLFEIVKIPHRRVKPKPNSTEILVKVVKFKYPHVPMHLIYHTLHAEPEEDEFEIELTMEYAHIGRRMDQDFYSAIFNQGEIGLSHSRITHGLGLSRQAVRAILRMQMKHNEISCYVFDKGRQRIHMYTASKYAGKVKETSQQLKQLNNISCCSEPNIPPIEEPRLKDIPQIKCQITLIVSEESNDMITERQILRRAYIIQAINMKCFFPIAYVRNIINEKERALGIKDEMTFKSLHRLLYSMAKKNLLKIYDFNLKYRDSTREYRYVTHPKIGVDHELLNYEAIKLKNSFYLGVHERMQREEAVAKMKAYQHYKELQKKKKRMTVVKSKVQVPLKGTRPPRFLIARYIHEFLHYIVVELNKRQPIYEVTEELLHQWRRTSPDLSVNEFWKEWNDEQKPVYSETLSWRTFIPPIRKYKDKPAGWLYLLDAFDRIPLSLLNKIYHVEKNHDELLTKYLSHPVRQHYLMRQLPLDLKDRINRAQLTKIFIMVIKVLNNMGLVQVGEKLGVRDPLGVWIFLNRYAELMDTTTTKPSYSRIDQTQEYPVQKFEFATGNQVNQYWLTLRHICGKTPLGTRRDPSREAEYITQMNFIGTVGFDEAPAKDTGVVPGNRLGAAGLSSTMFAHLARNWSWVCNSSTTVGQPRSRIVKILTRVRTRDRKVGRVHKKEKAPQVPAKRMNAEMLARKKSVTKYGPRDDIDRDALNNMRTLRVKWSPEEDAILKMARAVYLYVAAPVSSIGLLTVGKICRDIIRRVYGYNNKTRQACARRMQYLVRTRRHVPEVPSWLHALKANETVQQIYGESFLSNLKQVYPKREELCDALAMHFVLLLHHLFNMLNNEGALAMPQFCIPDTVAEFKRRFVVRDDEMDEKDVLPQNPVDETDIQIAVANSTLHSSLCSSRDKTSYNLQAFEIFKNYSEDVLNKAFQKARSENLCVAMKRRHIQQAPNHLVGPAYFLSSRYKMRLVSLPISYNVYSSFYDYLKLAIQTFFSSDMSDSPNVLRLKSPHCGHLVFITEGLVKNLWKVDLKLPTSILTVDLDLRNVIPATDRIIDHYSNILENAPTTEYSKQLEAECGDKQSRVQFYPANLSYKVYYAPYDFIAKLPKRYLHFFCALNFLNRRVDLNFNKLLRKDDEYDFMDIECPFTCILKSDNYISSIERIVGENCDVIDMLEDMAPEELLSNNPSTSKSNTVMVTPESLMAIVNLFESFARERELIHDRRDLGKMSSNLNPNRAVNWQALCQEILEFDATDFDQEKIDELEPTLHKEDRLVRAQEVFAVNLPTLTFDVSDELKATEKRRMFHGQLIPEILNPVDAMRKEILAKIINESHWKYTENTFESLQPLLDAMNFRAEEKKKLAEIHDFIKANPLGVTAAELLDTFCNRDNILARALKVFSEHYLIKRVGVATFMYVHKLHIRKWIVHTFHVTRLQIENQGGASKRPLAITEESEEEPAAKVPKTSEDAATRKRMSRRTKRFAEASTWDSPKVEPPKDTICMRPQPWIRLNGSLNRRVLDRWMGSILAECMARCGCSIVSICAQFPHLNPVDLMFLLEILSDIGCIHLTEIRPQIPNIFSKYEPIEEVIVTDLYDPENTYISVHADALSRMAMFIGDKEYTTEFI